MAVAIFMTSCEQVSVIEEDIDEVRLSALLAEYPEEITIDNWEEFVHAPQAVIDYHIEIERERLGLQNETQQIISTDIEDRGVICGWVRTGWLNNNIPVDDVRITRTPYIADSNSSWGNNYCIPGSSNVLCMSYNTPIVNGLSTLDLVFIARHIHPNYPPFAEAYQYVAADVTRNGIIDYNDINELRKGILGIYTSWPNSDDVIFMPSSDLNALQSMVPNIDLWTLGGIVLPGCLNTSLKNRYVIKTGDVNRSFSF